MKMSKNGIAVLCLGALLFANAAYAQWPVFDFTEIVPIGKDVKTGVDTVSDLKEQMAEMDKTLNAIGKEVNTVAVFSQDISAEKEGGAQEAADNAVSNSSASSSASGQAVNNASNATANTVNNQNNIVKDYVSQTQQVAGISNNAIKAPKNNLFSGYEEEEEEEEIPAGDETEEINQLRNETLAEQKQLAIELNDILETQLSELNKIVAGNIAAFEELDNTLQKTSDLSQADKERLHLRINEIAEKQREASDWAMRIVESAKENYNREYNNVIKDGINNYTKVVIAYMKGDASQKDVIDSGNKLKEATAAINVTPDSSVLAELKKTSEGINKEVENLAKDIKGILQKD